ncbi:HAMP domain-containing histidine kinase [Streptacidiphilus sp. NEAU-YB345]|uniref:histidine kinase n=1 Tax=Streptacidiphilus fuscans TaxID=2789292 RepID=A0A931FGU2_9ACTN|nr:HAMP domain-containing histidine kinase [Streptacidiphilus fuscans]
MRRPHLPRTLRGRLIAGLLALLVVTCAGVGLATTAELHRFLVAKVDQQLVDTGGRYAASFEHESHGDTRAQSVGTFGARLVDDKVIACGVVDGDADDLVGGDPDDHPKLDAHDQGRLAALPVGGPPHEVRLDGLGDFRMMAQRGGEGDVLVTGLPLSQVEGTVRQLILVEVLVFSVALAITAVAGTLWVRLALRPLDRVAGTAERVSGLPLASGEVALRERVPDQDPETEVGRVGVALNRMLGHVEDALAQRQSVEERLRGFAADASHELRTPVASIRGHAELALRHPTPTPDPVRHSLQRIEAESLRMGAIVEDLLLLARLDAGRPLASTEVDLTRLALDCTSDARAAGPEHRWRLKLPEEPVLIVGDPDRLRQVVANLLANARTHTPAGTEVTLALSRLEPAPDPVSASASTPDSTPASASTSASDPGTVLLTVTDTGPGIPPDLLPHVFERFVRGDRARTRATGSTGLGLAIVHAVATAHGGSVHVDSHPGRTVFEVRLRGEGQVRAQSDAGSDLCSKPGQVRTGSRG